MTHLFNSFNKYLFSTYYVSDTILVAWDISVKKKNQTKITEVKDLTSQKETHTLNMRNKQSV